MGNRGSWQLANQTKEYLILNTIYLIQFKSSTKTLESLEDPLPPDRYYLCFFRKDLYTVKDVKKFKSFVEDIVLTTFVSIGFRPRI